MKALLEKTLNTLNFLDSDRVSLVTYNPLSLTVTLKQHGNIFVVLSHLVGFLIPYKTTGILFPEDLKHIKDTIKYLLDHNITFLISPIKGGYRIYESGDTSYTTKPRFLTDINFYSLHNPIYCWISRLKNEEISMLYRRYKTSNKE